MAVNFENRVVENSDKYDLKHKDGTVEEVTLTSKATVVVEGTPLSATNLNTSFKGVEDSIDDCNTEIESCKQQINGCVKSNYTGGLKLEPCTQAEYDSTTHDANTLYAVK